MTKNKYADVFLQPKITQAGKYQVFTIKGKDTRGFDYTVRLSPVSEETIPGNLPETSPADRIEAYIGGNPKEIEKLTGAVEVKLGKEAEAHIIKEASMVYIPKGMPVKHRVKTEPKDMPFLLSFTLTPKWEEPAKKKKGGK
jgi:hypothetical protein